MQDGTGEDIIDSRTTPGARFEVIQKRELVGSSDVRSSEQLFYANATGMRLKWVRVTLNQGAIRVEPGALYYMHGKVEMDASTGGGIGRGLRRALTSGETLFVNQIRGTGTVVLEPTFGHFILLDIDNDEIIADRGLFFAGSADLDISSVMQRNVSSALFGGEGLFQTSIKGSGVAVLFAPVPIEELVEIQLDNETLQVDGNFALFRTRGVEFSVTKSSKSWLATSVSGEGLLQTFKGTGTVWIAPTQSIYDRLSGPEGLASLALTPGARSTNVDNK